MEGLADEALADSAEAITQLTRQSGRRDPDRNLLHRSFQRIKSIVSASRAPLTEIAVAVIDAEIKQLMLGK